MKLEKRAVALVFGLVFAMVGGAPVANAAHDFGGATVRFVSWDNRRPQEGTATYDRWIEAQERFNVTFEYGVLSDVLGQTMAGVLAGDAPELVEILTNIQLVPLAVQGALHPLDSILDDEYWESLPPPYQGRVGAKSALQVLGQTYATISIGPLATTVAMLWNKDLFEREGLPSLYELMESGEWTWERMKEIAIRATRDTDGDGQIDQWGVGGIISDATHFAVTSLMTNDVDIVREENGRIVTNLTDPAILEIYHHIYELNNVYNAVSPATWSDLSLFAQGKVAMQIIPFWQQTNAAVRSSVNVGLAFLPRGSKATEYRVPVYSIAALVVPITTKDPKAVIDLHHAIYPPEENAWLAVESHAAVQNDFESYDLVYRIAQEWEVASGFTSVFLSNGLGAAFERIVRGEQLPSVALSEVEPTIQAALDDLLGQN